MILELRPTAIFLQILMIIAVCSAVLFSCANEREQVDTMAEEPERTLEYSAEVSFITAGGDTISTIEAAVADDDDSRSTGLMNITSLPEDAGMLFIFEGDQPRSFWMANTPLSLDIIFVNSNKEIVRVHRNTQPFSQRSIESERPARYVVEVNAGYAVNHDIREGMKIAIQLTD